MNYKTLKEIYHGAEARIKLIEHNGKNYILKQRYSKSYREKKLDDKIIKRRIRSEAKFIERFNNLGFLSPKLIEVNEDEKYIIMTYLDAKTIKTQINKNNIIKLAKAVSKIHNNGIQHGDITLENVVYNGDIGFIDFGLSQMTTKAEDFAVDLFVFRETLTAEFDEKYWDIFIEEYKKYIENENVIPRFLKLERRRRNA